jgi:hypothetical protein
VTLHENCRQVLKNMSAARGIEVTVSTEPPIICTPYTTDAFICPHGTRYWMEPTSEQIAEWARDGVK